MKKHFLIIASIVSFLGLWSCEETEIFLGDAGKPADLKGIWTTYVTDTTGLITKTYYLANPKEDDGDQTYRDTVVTDSTQLTFEFVDGVIATNDSVVVTSQKRLNGVYQAPVNLPAGRWRYALGSSKGEDKSGVTYFNIYDFRYPNNTVTGYAQTYTYRMLSTSSMEIRWVATNGSPQNIQNFKAVLYKQ